MSDDKNDDGNVGSENSRGFKQPPPPRGRPPVPSAEQIAARKNAESARLTVEQEYDESLVERRASGQPIRPAPPLPSSSNQQAQDNYHAQQAAFDVAMGEWNAGNYTVDDDNESVSTFNSDDSFEQDGNNKAIEAHSDGSTHRDSPISEDTENELRGIFGAGKKAITELKESNQALNRSNSALINEWEEQSIVVKDQTKETKTKEKLEPGEIAVSNYKDTGKRQYRVFINGLGLTSGFLDDDTDLSDAQAVKDIVIRDLNTTYIDYNVDTFPPIDFNDEVMFKNYLAQMEVINEAAYEINKPAILKNEGLFGRLGDLASRDRADKSYKDQFKELAPNAMREAFLAQKVTVGVAGIDQKMIVMKDLPDYYKAQIKSKKSQLVGIGNASGGTQVRDRAELEAQIEDCKVMERSLRILVDAAYDPRMKSAQFLDMQKSGMETISKQMAAAGVRLKNFEKGIINNKIKVAGGTLTAGAVATAGYFMYGWITSGTATANAISDTAAMEAWFNGAGATMGSWGSSASSWGSGAVSTMGGWGGSALSWGSGAVSTMGGWGGSALSWGSGAVSTMGGWGGSALSWVTGAGLTMESGLIGFGLLTAGGALTATGIGAVVVLGVGLLVATDFAFNHGKISKAAAKGFVDFCKGTVGLVSMVAKSAKHQTQHMRLERGHYKSGTSDKFLEEGHEKVFKAIEDAVLSGVVALRVSNHGASQHLDLLKKIEPKGSMFEKVNYAATRAANRIDAPIAAHNNKPHCSRDSQDGLFKVTAPTQHKKMQKELVEEHLKYLKDAKYNLDRVVIEHHGELSPETIGQIKLLRKSLQVEIDATHVTEQALAFDIAETAVLDAIKRVALGGISKDSVKHNLEYARVKVGRLGAKVSEAEENVKQKNKAFKASNMLFAASVESLRQAKEALEQDPKNDDLQKIVVAEKHKNKKATERLATAKENLVSAQDSLSKAQKNMNKSMTEVSKLEQEHAAPTRGDQARATGTKIRQTIAGFTLEEAQAEVDSLSKQHQQLLDNVYEDTLDDEALNKRSEKLDKLSDKIKAAERLVFKLQSPTFLQSFKESVNWNGAKTKAEHSKLEAQHEAVQEQLKTDGGSDVAVTRALQSEARALRMEMRTLACLLEVKGEFEFVHGDESKIDDVMLLDAKDRMIREAKQDIKEVQVKVGAIDEAWNTGNTELYNQLRDPALVLELEHLNKGLNSLEMARKVIASRQEAQATKPEKESQAGFLKGISEALSKWWAKPLFKKSEAAEKGLFDDNDFDTSSTWDPSIDALQYDSDDLDDQQGRFRNTQGWGNKEVGDLVTSDTKPEERKSMFSGLTRLFKHKNQEILQSDPEQPEPKPLTQQEFDQQMVAAETAKEQLVELRDQYGDQTSDAWIEANDKVIEADNQINLLKLQDPTKVQDSELDDSDSYTF